MDNVIFFYLMRNEPELLQGLVQDHIRYWENLDLPGYIGGPFSDHSGGLIIFSSKDFDSANKLIEDDPFNRNQAIVYKQIKIWCVS
jgi:hypothetical protein